MTSLWRDRLPCSDASRLRRDENSATVARIDVWILIEFPGTWGKDPIRDAALPADVRNALLAASKEIPHSRIVFIRRRLEGEGRCRIFVARSGAEAGYGFVDLQSINDVPAFSFSSLLTSPNRNAPPLVLVCTHGQHDSCCGRRGYPLYDALRHYKEIETWQCSHVGGDRFAANAVVLPWGIFYGPVEREQSEALVESIMNHEIYLPSYRGRSTLSRPVQAADAIVRRATNILGRDALIFDSRHNFDDGRVMIRLREVSGTTHEVLLEEHVSTEEALATCTSKTAGPIRQYRLISHSSE